MLAAVAAGIVVLVLTSVNPRAPAPTGSVTSPTATVREFLEAALIRGDGIAACEFLTPAERRRVGGRGRCEAAAERRHRDRLPGYTIRPDGGRVVVSGLGRRFTFRLAPLPRSSRPEEVAPASGWRIASSAAALLR